ncbi:MAG: MGMT family protein [Myxococcota bacterium]|jgi:hypothetical protein|nr:MGMT family protein [Myxococcota bacterium]
MRKTAREKLEDNKDLPKIKPAPAIWGGGKMVIAHPTEFDALLKTVKKGRLITLDEVRALMAAKHGADICCPMTAGLFINIAAAAAQEDREQGKKRITPYWRCLKKNGELNAKFPGGIECHQDMLESEGHKVLQKGKKFFVEDFAKKLIALP